jgi:hypothetical protein
MANNLANSRSLAMPPTFARAFTFSLIETLLDLRLKQFKNEITTVVVGSLLMAISWLFVK